MTAGMRGNRGRASDFWTDDRVEQLKRLMAAGYSYAMIAAEIGSGCSRNAALGKAARLGLRYGKSRSPIVSLPRQPRLARSPRPKPNAERQRTIRTVLESVPLPKGEPDFADNPVTLLQLEPHHCRWPLGDPQQPDFHFCGGQRMTGVSYCARHVRRSIP